MSRFLQLHYLTVYPPSNPNRDDTGRPKHAVYGGAHRLRLSSQAIKRAVRQSPALQDRLQGHLGERTQRLGEVVTADLVNAGIAEEQALDIAKKVAVVFGKIDEAKAKTGMVRTRQLAFISPDEKATALEMAHAIAKGDDKIKEADLKKLILRTADGAADIAMFGRMLADEPDFNRDAAVQIAHAITTHAAAVEDDYYTAVDDLKTPAEDSGAGFVGEAGFGSGVYYVYANVNRDLLVQNLDGDTDLARAAIEALVEGLATSTPSGKRNSFAHHARAGYILAERGDQQPRSLASAFLKPVTPGPHHDLMAESVAALKLARDRLDRAYGDCADAREEMDCVAGTGTLAEVSAFAAKDLG